MSRFINPIPQYILTNGDLAAGGTLTFYEFNTDTLLPIYADEDETIPLANPVTLGDRGEVPNIFFSVAARVVLADSEGTEIFDVQPTATSGSGSGGINGWNSNTTYGQLSIVYGSDGEFYISLVNENLGNDPADDTDDSPSWTRLEFIKFWNDQETYAANDIVLRGSTFYVSQIADNLNNDPALDTVNNWKDLTDASLSPYDNTASGLAADNVKTALDELQTVIDAITQPFVYKGVLDVSSGDAALPSSPSNGDLYVIGVGGTITISVDGAAPAATAVTQGEQIAYNSTDAQWDLYPYSQQASAIQYVNTTSGLSATDVQNALDEIDAQVDTNVADISTINSTLAGLGSAVTYKGQLDVSGGDAALPSSPSNGDLYAISVGGTITVSVNGAAPTPTAVTAGEQIVYNGDTPAWDLLQSATSAGQISYSNATSGLSATDVQAAIDEVDANVDTNATDIAALQAKEDVSFALANSTATVTKAATLTDLTKTNTSSITLTLDDATYSAEDVVRIRKTQETGVVTVNTTNNQVAPDGTTATSNNLADGAAATVELVYTGSVWNWRVF